MMRSYWKYFIFIVIIFLGFIPRWFSYFEGKMYCDITKDRIIISLDNKKFYTCDIYVRYIETQMKAVYKDILLIQKYIDKKEDLWYWKPLKEEKIAFLNLLQNMRLNILSHTKTFEMNLLETSRNYFLNSIDDYKKNLIKSLNYLQYSKDYNVLKSLSLFKQQLENIENISQAKTFKQLDYYIKNYVYLKNQIWWK